MDTVKITTFFVTLANKITIPAAYYPILFKHKIQCFICPVALLGYPEINNPLQGRPSAK